MNVVLHVLGEGAFTARASPYGVYRMECSRRCIPCSPQQQFVGQDVVSHIWHVSMCCMLRARCAARRSLCSFTHPLVNNATFNNLNALKRKLLEQHKLHFCDLCIKGRKVRNHNQQQQ